MTTPMRALVARQRETAAVDAAVDKLRWLLAHPPTSRAATPGEGAEIRHLLHDADPDATTRPFVDLRKGRKL